MSIERVRKYLQQFGRGDDIIETAASSATVELAAAALGVEPARIAKTLSFMAKSGSYSYRCGRGLQNRQPQIQRTVRLQGKNAFSG